jgi:hypothetical protein
MTDVSNACAFIGGQHPWWPGAILLGVDELEAQQS